MSWRRVKGKDPPDKSLFLKNINGPQQVTTGPSKSKKRSQEKSPTSTKTTPPAKKIQAPNENISSIASVSNSSNLSIIGTTDSDLARLGVEHLLRLAKEKLKPSQTESSISIQSKNSQKVSTSLPTQGLSELVTHIFPTTSVSQDPVSTPGCPNLSH